MSSSPTSMSSPSVTFQVESWASYYSDPEREALWCEHYSELAVDKDEMPCGPDIHLFTSLDAIGALQILTARAAGRMIGYFLTVVRPHTHYCSVLCGFEDSYFISKPFRRGLTGVKLIKENERLLRARGVKKLFVMTKTSKDLGMIYDRLGYHCSDYTYAKWIGERKEV